MEMKGSVGGRDGNGGGSDGADGGKGSDEDGGEDGVGDNDGGFGAGELILNQNILIQPYQLVKF